MKERIRIRRDSTYNWNFYNPVLATGEAGYETDTNRLKVGNGTGTWSQLPYLIGSNIYSLKLGDGSSDSLTWLVNDRLNLVGSGSTSILFNQSTNTVTFSSPSSIAPTKSSVTGALGYLPQITGDYSIVGHSHTISEIPNLQLVLDSKQPTGIYASGNHKHQIADISGLVTALSSKQPAGDYAPLDHYHPLYISDGNTRVITYGSFEDLKIKGSGNTYIVFNDSTNTITIASSGSTGGTSNVDLTNVVFTTGNQRVSGIKVSVNSGIFIGGIVGSGNISLQIPSGQSSPSHFIVFSSDPASAAKPIHTRTSSQVRSDIGLENLTNDTQIKRSIDPTVIGYIPTWNSTSGDLLGTGYIISNNLSINSGAIYIPRADAVVNYVSSRNIVAGSGLSGGGYINTDPIINIGQGDGIIVSENSISVNNTIVRTTGNQNIDGIKSFVTGLFSSRVSGHEGIFENLFTNSIDLIGTNNKIFLTAGTGISFYFHDEDNILEIAADASVESIGDTMVLRNLQGDIYSRDAYLRYISAEQIHGTGGQLNIVGNANVIVDTSTIITNNNGNGSNNLIAGAYNDGYGAYDIFVQLGIQNPYAGSTNLVCIGNSNIYKGSDKSLILGNECAVVNANNSVCLGTNTYISTTGQMSYTNGRFQYNGDSQKTTYLVRCVSLGDQSSVLTLDGSVPTINNILVVPPETTWAFYGQISAYDYINGYGAAFNIRGGIRRNQNNETVLIGSFIKESWIEPEIEGIYVSISADDTTDSLKLEAIGKDGSNIKWTAELNIIQNSNTGFNAGIL